MSKLNITNFFELSKIFYADNILESEKAYEITYYGGRVIDNYSNEIKFIKYYIYKELNENTEVEVECSIVCREYEQLLPVENGQLIVTSKKKYYFYPQNLKSELLRLIAQKILLLIDEF